jgi:hypothetical protein
MITDEALFEAMVEMDLDNEPLSNEDLTAVIGDILKDSDANLRAAAWFFGLNVERLEEKAASLEVDEKIPRVTANRLALERTLKGYMPDMAKKLCAWFSRNAVGIHEVAVNHDLTLWQAWDEVLDYFKRHNGEQSEVARDMDALLERFV